MCEHWKIKNKIHTLVNMWQFYAPRRHFVNVLWRVSLICYQAMLWKIHLNLFNLCESRTRRRRYKEKRMTQNLAVIDLITRKNLESIPKSPQKVLHKKPNIQTFILVRGIVWKRQRYAPEQDGCRATSWFVNKLDLHFIKCAQEAVEGSVDFIKLRRYKT